MEWIKEKESTRHLQTGYLTGSNQEGSFEAKTYVSSEPISGV